MMETMSKSPQPLSDGGGRVVDIPLLGQQRSNPCEEGGDNLDTERAMEGQDRNVTARRRCLMMIVLLTAVVAIVAPAAIYLHRRDEDRKAYVWNMNSSATVVSSPPTALSSLPLSSPYVGDTQIDYDVLVQPQAPTIRTDVDAWKPLENFTWCVPEEWKTSGGNIFNTNKDKTYHTGFLYVKVHKSASSTAAGIAYRIATNVGSRMLKNQLPCRVQAHHGTAMRRKYKSRERKGRKSFLWTIIRHPTSRSLSAFYYFRVNKHNEKPTYKNFMKTVGAGSGGMGMTLPNGSGGYTASYLRTKEVSKVTSSNVDGYVRGILDEYDFVGVVERFDESMVALRLLLDLPPGDILHFNAKVRHSDEGEGVSSYCPEDRYETYMTPEMESYYESSEWKKLNIADIALHDAANAKLDATIVSLGARKFQEALDLHRRLQLRVNEECPLPCHKSDTYKKENCYWHDNGCGYPCIDQMVLEIQKEDNAGR